ncbi:MAG: hypothetical protein KGQ66_00300 [Acidobacteriota bacterium]|nr:hypothetical protein [Acidobacteriota bacterium]
MGFTHAATDWTSWAEDWKSVTASRATGTLGHWQIDTTPPLATLLADLDQMNAAGETSLLRARRGQLEAAIVSVKRKLERLRSTLDIDDPADLAVIELIDRGRLRLNSALTDISNALDYQSR